MTFTPQVLSAVSLFLTLFLYFSLMLSLVFTAKVKVFLTRVLSTRMCTNSFIKTTPRMRMIIYSYRCPRRLSFCTDFPHVSYEKITKYICMCLYIYTLDEQVYLYFSILFYFVFCFFFFYD